MKRKSQKNTTVLRPIRKFPSTKMQRRRPLKIVHLGKYFSPATGGMETYVKTLVECERRLGLDSRVICLNHEGKKTIRETVDGIPVTRIGHSFSISKFDVCLDLNEELNNLDADLVHLHAPNPSMIMGLLRTDWSWPVVVTYHSDHINFPILSRLFAPFENRFYQHVDTIISTSPPYAEYSPLLKQYEHKVRIVPMGIALEPYLRPTAGIQREAKQIKKKYSSPIWLTCGRLVPYKGIEFAIRAMEHVKGTLLIIGTGPLQTELEVLRDQLGLEERIHFLGRLSSDEMISHYLSADALLFPSIYRSEAYGLVQIEAMAAKCPVINTFIEGSGVPWVGLHNETALTVNPASETELAEAARRIHSDALLRKRLVSAARKRVIEEFDETKITQRIIDIYHNACGISEPSTMTPPVYARRKR